MPVLSPVKLELGEIVSVAGRLLPLTSVCPFTSSQSLALDAVAVKLIAEELETVTLVACGKLPPVLYVHGTEDWLSSKLPLEITSNVTGIS